MASRTHYWCCSKFADWIRGTDKPYAETSEGWRTWKRASKKSNPIRYWIAEEGLDYLQDIVMWPSDFLYSIKYYINNRWVTKTHALTAHPRDIKPGEWCDVGYRFLPCLFNELRDFVEVELAWFHIAWADKNEKRKYDAPFWATGWFRWRTWRCPQAGLDNLKWQRNLVWTKDEVGEDSPELGKPTHQAIKAQEILDLYKWWTEVYPNRPDPYDASGWSALCEERRADNEDGEWFLNEDKTPEQRRKTKKALDLCNKIEAKYEKEDEAMLIRLIKIRKSLWT